MGHALKKLRQFFAKYKYAVVRPFFRITPRAKGINLKSKNGINLIGFYAEGMGLGQALRNVAGALLNANIPFVVRKLFFRLTSSKENLSMQRYLYNRCIHRYNLICINPDFLYRLPLILRPGEWLIPYNIGYWFWEMPEFPKSWQYALHIVDEIWVSSDFTLDAMKKISSNVIKIPFAVEFYVDSYKFSRAYFGLPENVFIFLYSFDFNSSYWRKNPAAVIRAFQRAFPHQQNNSVHLLIKVSNVRIDSEEFLDLQKAINFDPRVSLREDDFDRCQMQGLLSVVDAYVSLHRAESLGLVMAESMYLGKPVIATGYSGNMEYMNTLNSCLVAYDLIPVTNGDYIESEGQYWAEPNIDEAAGYMMKISSDESFRNALGKAAALYIRENHSFQKMGISIQNRLQELENKFNYGRACS